MATTTELPAGTLDQHLWPLGAGPSAPQAYALLDAARDEAIAPLTWHSPLPSTCLYAGTLSPALQRAAPYLVQLSPRAALTDTLLRHWGDAWGVWMVAPADVTLQALRRHWRQWTRVEAPDGSRLVFRFYDPRVLRVFLPTCTPAETERFFGPVQRLYVESEAPGQAIVYSHQRGRLHTATVPLGPGKS